MKISLLGNKHTLGDIQGTSAVSYSSNIFLVGFALNLMRIST